MKTIKIILSSLCYGVGFIVGELGMFVTRLALSFISIGDLIKEET